MPALAPRRTCYLAVKNEYQDRPPYGELRDGHAQVIVPKVGYFGLSYEGYFKGGGRKYTMKDPMRMRHPDTVLGCSLQDGGVESMKAVESEMTLDSKKAPYDRDGKKGPNCLIAAARIFAAGTGAVLTAYKPAGTLTDFSNDVQKELVGQGISVDRKDGKDVRSLKKVWRDIPDKDPNMRNEESDSEPDAP